MALVTSVAGAALAWCYLQRPTAPDASRLSPRQGGRFTAQSLLCADRARLLDRLGQAFPGCRVLPGVSVAQVISLRGGSDLRQRRELLRAHVLDFVVLDAQGCARWVFKIGGGQPRFATRTVDREDAYVIWALKQAGITTFRLSALDSQISVQRLRDAVGMVEPQAFDAERTVSMRGAAPQVPGGYRA